MANHNKRAKTGGRTKGSRNKSTIARESAIIRSGQSPLDYMLKVMRNTKASPARRDWAAGAAAPYVHARLAAIEHSGPNGGPIQHEVSPRERIASRLARIAERTRA